MLLHDKRLWKCHNLDRRVARIWKKGGGTILKEWEKCKRPWPKFSLLLNQFHTVCTKIETKFLGKLGNSKVFSAQNQVVSKKKKVFNDFETDSNVFSAQNQMVSKKKKKKGLHRFWDWFFGRNLQFKRFFRPKSKVFTDFETDFSAEIENSKGLEPPPPLATLLNLDEKAICRGRNNQLFQRLARRASCNKC